MENRKFVIGIAGGTASGKTTFTCTLERALSNYVIKVIHMDDYFKKAECRPFSKAPITGAMYIDDNHPLTMDLPKLATDLECYINSSKYDVIIVEGLLTLWDENIEKQLDLRLFVECRNDERTVRRIRRHMGWGQSFEEITSVYLDLVRYRHDEYVEPTKWKADFFINGSRPSQLAVDSICALVDRKLNT